MSGEILLDVLQLLEKGTNGIPIAGTFLSSGFGIASVITEKTQKLKDCPKSLRSLAKNIQDLLLTFENHYKEHRHASQSSVELTSALYEIEQYVQVYVNSSTS